MANHHIDPGESTLLISADDSREYWVTVSGASVRFGRTEAAAENDQQSRLGPAGDRGPMRTTATNEEVWAHNPDTNTRTAIIEMDHNGFLWDRQPRDVIAGVLGSDDNPRAPASDDFVHRFGNAADPSVGVTESFTAPDRADWIVVGVDDANDAFEIAVQFEDSEGNEVVTRDKNSLADPVGTYTGDASTDAYARVAVGSPFVTVSITGAATAADYTVYAR